MKKNAKSKKPTRKIPRGPPEWGEIIYEPRWVYESKYREFGRIGLHLSFAIFASVISFILIIMNINEYDETHVYPFIILFFIAFPTGIYEILMLYKSMPFRIYEKGVTQPFIPFRMGMHREEILIPFSRVHSIRFNKWGSITLGYLSEDGSKKRSLIDDHSPDDIDIIEDTMIKKVKSIEIIDRRS